MIILTKKDYLKIVDYSKKKLPNEACGLLAGEKIDSVSVIKKVYLMKNMDESPEHFSMDPKEQFSAVRDMRNQGWEVLGNFHSHPETPSRPSEEDKRLAFDSEAIYLILSLMDIDKPVLKGFNIENQNVEELEIKIDLGKENMENG